MIGFEPSEETVAEDDGTVELCARLLSENPTLEREVVVSFSTQDGEAEGESAWCDGVRVMTHVIECKLLNCDKRNLI